MAKIAKHSKHATTRINVGYFVCGVGLTLSAAYVRLLYILIIARLDRIEGFLSQAFK